MRLPASAARCSSQRGGFVLGLIVGVLAGLAVALGVALYVTKVPVPFINKVPQRNAEQDAVQAEKDRNWDPNAALSGKSTTKAAGAASGVVTPGGADRSTAARGTQTPGTPTPGATPPDGSAATSAVAAVLPVTYYVQAGAYARSDDAEQQRANLGLLGLSAKVTEREQAGRTVYRVRVGPFERKEDADTAKERLSGAGIDAALVRVQR